MTSKISLNKLIREDLHHRTWQIVLSCLVQILFGPLALMLFITVYGLNDYYKEADRWLRIMAEFFSGYYLIIVMIIAFVGALIVALAGYHYLFNRRMTDLYHSVPVTRTRLFFSKYLTGLMVWALPALGGYILTILIAIPRIGFGADTSAVWANALRCLWAQTFAFFAIYHLILLCITLSGTIFNTLVNIVLLGFDAAITYGILYMLCSSYLDTFVELGVSFGDICWLSQPIAAVAMADPAQFGMSTLFVVGSIVVMLLNLFLAVLANKKRASEQAETGVEIKPLAASLRILNTILAGILGGAAMHFLTEGNVIWILIGIIIAGVLTYGIIDIIHQRAFRAFFSHKVLMIISVAASALIYLCVRGDWIGYDTYLPMRSNISEATITVNSYQQSSFLRFDENGVPYEYWYNSYYSDGNEAGFRVADGDAIYELLEAGTRYEAVRDQVPSEDDFVAHVYITVNRRLRCNYQRQYQLQGDAVSALKKVIDSEDYRNRYYPTASGCYPTPTHINIEDCMYQSASLNGTTRDLILSTYYREFKEQYCLEFLASYIEVGSLEFYYEVPKSQNSRRSTYTVEIPIYSTFHDTIELLNKYCPDLKFNVEAEDLYALQLEDWIPYTEEMGDPSTVIGSYYELGGYPEYERPSEYDQRIVVTYRYNADLRDLLPYAVPGYYSYEGDHFSGQYVCIGYTDMDGYRSTNIFVPTEYLRDNWTSQLSYTVSSTDYSVYYDPYGKGVDYSFAYGRYIE